MSTNLPPRRAIEDHVAYEVVCIDEPSVRFRVIAETEGGAKIEALDKIGYSIVHDDGRFILVDADDTDQVETALTAMTFEQALTVAFQHLRWFVNEPTQMIGGALSDGFGEVDDE